MNTATLALDPLRPQRLGGWGRGMALALVAHIGLVVALAIATRWRTESEAVVAAELWSAVPQIAAPKPVEPEPEPEPPKPEPVKPEPLKPPPPPKPSAAELQAQREADIALERDRQRKERERQAAEREAERRKAEKEAREEKERKERLEREKAAREKAAKEKAAKDKEKAEKQKEKEKAEREKDAKDKAAKERTEREKAEREAEKRRQENLKRIQGLAGATGAPDATGTALQSGAPSASYLGRIVARIKPNIVFTEGSAGNPRAVVVLRIAPDGTIVGRRLKTPSGDDAWDEAVLRAIDRTAVLPRDTDGRVPPELEIGFRPRE